MIFEAENYKSLIRDLLEDKKFAHGKRFSYQNLANACGVQKTYLSKVLNHSAHLTSDQLFLATEYLELGKEQSRFLFLLHEYERTKIHNRKKNIHEKIEELRSRNYSTQNYISAQSEAAEIKDFTEYHLNPIFQIVHMFLTISSYAAEIRRISGKLGLSMEVIQKTVDGLAQLGIVVWEEDKWVVKKDSIHLAANSKIFGAYRKLNSLKTQDQLERLPEEKKYSFSVIFSTSPKVRREIQDAFFSFLKTVQTRVKKSEEEHVYQMNFDLFTWSEN